MIRRRVFWVELNRFDTKLDKSTWVEIGEVLHREGLEVTLLTGYDRVPYHVPGAGMVIQSFSAPQGSGLFRYGLLAAIVRYLWSRVGPGDIVIARTHALWGCVWLKWFKGCHLHLDERTLPVGVASPKFYLDRWLFWTFSWRLFSRFSSSFSFITERLRMAVAEEFNLSFPEYAIWTSGVNFSIFSPDPGAGLPPLDGRYELLYHGSLVATRGVDQLIAAMLHFGQEWRDRVRLRIVGAGSDLPRLKEWVRANGLAEKVRFDGFIPYDQIPKAICGAHLYVCPLPDRPEWNVSSPIKVFEYIACGRPMVLTPIPAHRDIAGEMGSVVWTAGWQPLDFAQAVEEALTRYSVLAREALRVREWAAQRYSWEGQGRSLADYLKRSAGDR